MINCPFCLFEFKIKSSINSYCCQNCLLDDFHLFKFTTKKNLVTSITIYLKNILVMVYFDFNNKSITVDYDVYHPEDLIWIYDQSVTVNSIFMPNLKDLAAIENKIKTIINFS